MAPPRKFKKGTRAYSFRADAETWDEFAKIARDRDELLTDIFQATVDDYIKKYGKQSESVQDSTPKEEEGTA